MHVALVALAVLTAYLREVAWLDILVRMPEMVLTQPGRAQGCRGTASRGGVCVFSIARIFLSPNITCCVQKISTLMPDSVLRLCLFNAG